MSTLVQGTAEIVDEDIAQMPSKIQNIKSKVFDQNRNDNEMPAANIVKTLAKNKIV